VYIEHYYKANWMVVKHR